MTAGQASIAAIRQSIARPVICNLPKRKAGYRVAPLGGYFCRRSDDEGTFAKQGVRNNQVAGFPKATTPQYDIQIEWPCAPGRSAPPSAKTQFKLLQLPQKMRRLDRCLHQSRGIRIEALGRTDWAAAAGRRDRCNIPGLRQSNCGCIHDMMRRADTRHPHVRPDRDQIAMDHAGVPNRLFRAGRCENSPRLILRFRLKTPVVSIVKGTRISLE